MAPMAVPSQRRLGLCNIVVVVVVVVIVGVWRGILGVSSGLGEITPLLSVIEGTAHADSGLEFNVYISRLGLYCIVLYWIGWGRAFPVLFPLASNQPFRFLRQRNDTKRN